MLSKISESKHLSHAQLQIIRRKYWYTKLQRNLMKAVTGVADSIVNGNSKRKIQMHTNVHIRARKPTNCQQNPRKQAIYIPNHWYAGMDEGHSYSPPCSKSGGKDTETRIQKHMHILTLKAPRKPASENVVCLCCLLNILANFSNVFLHTGKQCGRRSDCSFRSSLIWSTLFAEMTFKLTGRRQSRRQ